MRNGERIEPFLTRDEWKAKLIGREGARPETSVELPHRQVTEHAPAEQWEGLITWVFSHRGIVKPDVPALDGHRAVVLESSVSLRRPETSLGLPGQAVEPVRLQGADDTSIHLCLPKERARDVCALGLAEPLLSDEDGTRILVYGPRDRHELIARFHLIVESIEWARSSNQPDPVSAADPVVVFDGPVGVAAHFTKLKSTYEWPRYQYPSLQHPSPNPYKGQANGICGAAEAGILMLITGLYDGHALMRVVVCSSEPTVGDSWEDIVEVPFQPTSSEVWLHNWDGESLVGFHLDPGDYRVRYSARGMDLGNEHVRTPDGTWPPDFYELAFWPVKHRTSDRIVRASSRQAKYRNAHYGAQSQSAVATERRGGMAV